MFRVDKFEMKKAKEKPGKQVSVNLNPVLTIINNGTLQNRRIPENLNTQAGWVQKDFVHSLGLKMDDGNLPGDFVCTVHGPACAEFLDHPDKFTYQGPMSGQVGECEVVMVPNNKGGTRAAVKQYICKVPGCTEYHSENLAS